MNSKDDFSESIRSGLDCRLRKGLRWEMTQLLPEERRNVKRTKTYDGTEWRGVANAVFFERTTGVTLKRRGTRAAALFASWYCSTAFYNQLVEQSVVNVVNSPIPTRLCFTRVNLQLVIASRQFPLLPLSCIIYFRSLIATDWIAFSTRERIAGTRE